MLPQTVIDAMRSGTPIVGAMVGPVVARERGKQVSSLKQIAGYSFAGWLTAYVAQRAVFWVLDNVGQTRLPTEVSSLTAAPTAGIYATEAPVGVTESAPIPKEVPRSVPEANMTQAEVQNEGVREIDETDNVVNIVPQKIKQNMLDAYGSEV